VLAALSVGNSGMVGMVDRGLIELGLRVMGLPLVPSTARQFERCRMRTVDANRQ
jgi:hypothetical protein